MRYRERLWPTPWVYIACLLLIPAGLFVFLPINEIAGYVAATVLFIGGLVFFTLTARTIEVTDGQLIVGRARLPREFAGKAESFRGIEANFERGPGLDARAYTLFQAGITSVVKVENTDPDDPTPYWLFASRRGDDVLRALGQQG